VADAAPVAGAPDPRLSAECAAWSRYLLGVEPSEAVVARYVDAHRRGVVAVPGSEEAFDRALVLCARTGSFAARVCDVHARLFRPAGLLRRKLVLALALLEVDAAAHARVDDVRAASPAAVIAGLGVSALVFALLAAGGLVVLLPVRVVCLFVPGSARRA
jgi:hypothetical protein